MKKRALITAATSSIGQGIARGLHADGYELVLHYYRNTALAEVLAKELDATLVRADLSSEGGVKGFIKEITELKNFDVIINNAGLADAHSDTDQTAWEKVLRLNSVVPALILGHANTLVRDGGQVVNISSAYGHERFGEKGYAAYSASKATLNSITRTFAKQLAPRVRVNGIAPGYVDSRWNEDFSPSERKRLAGEQLIGKLITVEQVVDLLLQVLKNDAIDGEIIYIDGGLTLKTI